MAQSTMSSRIALSKLVEFPGDPVKLSEWLHCRSDIDFGGKDMYGLAAIHKFASWNKVDLLELLLPVLTVEQINAHGGSNHYHCLHWCVDMNAMSALTWLLNNDLVDKTVVDRNGKTYLDLMHEKSPSVASNI
jgi:hypothetical protein